MLVDVYDLFDRLRAVIVRLADVLEGHLAFFDGKHGVVFAEHGASSREDDRAALADDDRTRLGLLSGVELGSEIFRI